MSVSYTEMKRKTNNKNYFRRTRALLNEKLKEYDDCFMPEERANIKNIISLLNEIESYLKSIPFLNDAGRERITVYYDAFFDVKETCQRLDISRDTFDKFISRTNSRLKEKFGERLFQYIENNVYNEALLEFRLNTRNFKATGLMTMDFLTAIGDEKATKQYKLSECLDELQLFRLYSHHAMLSNIAKVDPEKMNYILYVLSSGSEGVRYEGEFLTNYLHGKLVNTTGERELNFNEFISELRERGL